MDEKEEISQVTLFFKHIIIFSGMIFWLGVTLVIFGDYQVGWKRVNSVSETVINQINQEAVINQLQEDTLKRRK